MPSPPAVALAAACLTTGLFGLAVATAPRTYPPPPAGDSRPASTRGFPMPVLVPDATAYRMPVLTPDPDRFPTPILNP